MTCGQSVDYGPLQGLIGRWEGEKGLDRSPEPEGDEQTPYKETLRFEVAGSVTNAEKQSLSAIRYHQVVSRQSDGGVFHDETGYWMWDGSSKTVMHSLTIPRGLALLAGGVSCCDADKGVIELTVRAEVGDARWGIVQSPFMSSKAKTVSYRQSVFLGEDEMSYSQTMMLDIYGRSFEHTDSSSLKRIK